MTALAVTRPAPPDPAIASAARGMALLAGGDTAAALTELQAAVAAGDASGPTLLNLALALDAEGQPAPARALMREVAATLPGWDEPHLRLAESFRRRRAIPEALDSYRAALAREPNRVESLIGCGVLLIGQGDGVAAQHFLLRACGRAADNPQAWDALGLALMLSGDVGAAGSAFDVARRLAPANFTFALHAIEAAIAAGAVEAERARLDLALRAAPADPLGHTMHGLLLEHLGERAAAIDALEAAVALAPTAPIPLGILGGMLARSLRLGEARDMLQRARQVDPDNARVCADLGAVLMRMHHPAEACDMLHDLLCRVQPQLGILSNLANATAGCGRQDEAVAVAYQAIALNPEATLGWRALLGTLPYAPDSDGAAMLAAARACAERMPSAAAPPRPPSDGRRLRIGLLSGSFRVHPVGWLTVAGLETLDPAAFDLVFFAQNTGTDPISRRFRAIAAQWFDIDFQDDQAVADLIRGARIDILIDLGGYGEGGRLPVCALRPAPVQVKWVGMQCHSTGLPAIDFFLADRWEIPPELERFYSERIVRLPDGYVCYSPPPYAPDVEPLPALRRGHITFGCFNNLAKMTPRVLAAWAEILVRVPQARLLIKTPQFGHAGTAEAVRRAFTERGIDAARIDLHGASRHRAFLGEYNKIDIVLDPFPYTGGLTTCEALWMGVPTITLPGETFASRHSLSHLSNVGLDDWAAGSVEDYIAQAVRRAGDVAALADLRVGLRARVKASALCDAPRFGRNLGVALRGMWETREGK